MTKITLYNTKTRKKERFEPLDPRNVRMYVCGPTVYDRAHLGNARPVVVFDVLYRLLRHVYGADHVTYVRNFTDVDDKINARAVENVGENGDVMAEIARLTETTTQWFLDDMGALGALEPDEMPRATAYIPQMIDMIETLIEKGHAYEAEDHVLFSVDSWREKYGQLSGRSVDDMIAGARVDPAPYKRNPMDFVLWKPSTPELPGWDSPWGRGRPGWHIECSAMSYELLGDSFDIHGGGGDLMFPHHENEIAQSCCAHPQGDFARYWLHNEMLQVEGKKMAKSEGNFFTVRDLLDAGVRGEVIRFVFLSTHYRKPMDWTERRRKEAEQTLRKWETALKIADRYLAYARPDPQSLPPYLVDQLADDMNTHAAITLLDGRAELLLGIEDGRISHDFSDDRLALGELGQAYRNGLELIGLAGIGEWQQQRDIERDSHSSTVELYLAKRADAKKRKDFATADRLRDELGAAGVIVKDTPEGTEWDIGPDFDPAKLEAFK
ncbi:cysteine--tRNA ligase [Roseovarius salis]|uniref:cysteine--tRNA ligase n=1 Tax=Roseovarius salis TaxID=3376063 RepID=UPI0037CC66B9